MAIQLHLGSLNFKTVRGVHSSIPLILALFFPTRVRLQTPEPAQVLYTHIVCDAAAMLLLLRGTTGRLRHTTRRRHSSSSVSEPDP